MLWYGGERTKLFFISQKWSGEVLRFDRSGIRRVVSARKRFSMMITFIIPRWPVEIERVIWSFVPFSWHVSIICQYPYMYSVTLSLSLNVYSSSDLQLRMFHLILQSTNNKLESNECLMQMAIQTIFFTRVNMQCCEAKQKNFDKQKSFGLNIAHITEE